MSRSPLPLRYHPRIQEELIWWSTASDGDLGRRSIQGSIQARLEGSQGGFEASDLITDPEAAFKLATGKVGFHAAGRVRKLEKAWNKCTFEVQTGVSAVWMSKPHLGLDAFGHWANMVISSEEAIKFWTKVRSKMEIGEWLTRLSAKKTGSPTKEGRSSPTATGSDLAQISAINRECERIATRNLMSFVHSYRLENI